MKLPKPKTKKLRIILIAIAAALVLGGGTLAYFLSNQKNNLQSAEGPRPVNTIDYGPPTEQEKQEASDKKDEIIKQEEARQEAEKNPEAVKNINLSITRAGQVGDVVSIRTVISGTSSGTCNVQFTKSEQPTLTKTFPIAFEATSASCQGADVPVSEFSAGGDWTLSISAVSGGYGSSTITQSVTITK